MSLRIRWGRFDAKLRFRFKHASYDRRATENVIVEVETDGARGYGEGCPRSYVTGETQASAFTFLAVHAPAFAAEVSDVDSLRAWIARRRDVIDANPAAFAALELAALDGFGRRVAAPLEALIGVARGQGVFSYTGVMGDTGPTASAALAGVYRLWDMHDLKIKLSGRADRDAARLRAIQSVAGSRARLRADANNVWTDPGACIAALLALDNPFWAIEEPLARGDIDGMREIAEALGVRIILDESLLRVEELAALPADPAMWIANIRISKAGGVLRAIALAEAARARGHGAVLGAHVGESSLLTRAALAVAQAAGPELLAQEGAYGDMLLARDLTRPSLKFGRGGRLDLRGAGVLDRPGLGLAVDPARVDWVG